MTEEIIERFKVLKNPQGRHALWPEFRSLPKGWQEVLSPRSRADCLEYVNRHWPNDGLHAETRQAQGMTTPSPSTRCGFGLLFFGGDERHAAQAKYDCVIQAARFADEHGFTAVWLPERHFTPMGSLYPSPAVLHAALSRETRRLRLRAGSVVLPLHDPIRVVEEWAIVDNLSGGRVEISFAPGWNSEDFALNPGNYERRYDVMFQGIHLVDRLWRGETITARGGNGENMQLRTYPTPVQPRLIKWITAAGSARTFQQAGAIGANLLTHLFDHDVEELAGKIKLYRQTRAEHGHDPDAGRIAVTLHTFLAPTLDEVIRKAHGPYCQYLKSNRGLLEKLAQNRGCHIDLSTLTGRRLDEAVDFIFDKFLKQRSLLGTPDQCAGLVEQLIAIGVHEIACLIDFGPSNEDILASLKFLGDLKERFAARQA